MLAKIGDFAAIVEAAAGDSYTYSIVSSPFAGRQLDVDHQRRSRWRELNDDMGRQI
jgi:hypothetical protein